MHIVIIGWLYVAMMMAITERSVTAGVLSFFFYGLVPCAVLFWLSGSRLRRRAAKRQAVEGVPPSNEQVNHPDRTDTRPDQ